MFTYALICVRAGALFNWVQEFTKRTKGEQPDDEKPEDGAAEVSGGQTPDLPPTEDTSVDRADTQRQFDTSVDRELTVVLGQTDMYPALPERNTPAMLDAMRVTRHVVGCMWWMYLWVGHA